MSFRFVDHPLVFLLAALIILFVSAYYGLSLRKKHALTDADRDEVTLVLNGALTLLALIVGFTFSMAVARYDLRKADEANEANAIGTEYRRAGLLDAADAAILQRSLSKYVNLRIVWYTTHDLDVAKDIVVQETALGDVMWGVVERAARGNPTAVNALVAAGLNDLLDNAGYAEAAWANRIPVAAWAMMLLIAIACSVLLGYGVRPAQKPFRAIYILPALIAIALFMIADLDSTRHGLINVNANDLTALADQLKR